MLLLSETIAKAVEEQHISVRELAKRAYRNLRTGGAPTATPPRH